MSTVNEHYERLLWKHYTWMFAASFEERVDQEKSLLSHALEAVKNKPERALAVDLGSGPGFQTVALAQLGFSPVIAIDSSSELLDELRSHIDSFSVQIEKADLRDLPTIVAAGDASVIVCMGDTLTHLASKADVSALFQDVFDALHAGGVFVITYRDLTKDLEGLDRFIPVQSDDNTIMTCFLEYESAESVVVHDLVYTRDGAAWSLSKSSYRKLRLGVDWLVQELNAVGLVVVSEGTAGRLMRVVAAKP
jgi:protein-L-isoaspartate O-methyltransferase